MHARLFVLAATSFVALAGPAVTVPDNPLSTLRSAHPRLLATDAEIDTLRKTIASDPRAKRMFDQLTAEAAKLETAAPVVHKLIGPRLLDQSRRALDRVYTLALMFRITGEKRYRDRAVKELKAAAEFPNWNPSHFLDTAEMTHAFAIGYDWLFSALSDEERQWMRKAIVEKGINQALPIYDAKRWWTIAHHNWNQVCNGGIGIGALAIASEEPALATRVIKEAVKSIPLAMQSYGPEGGWNEGPGYWAYATRYNVVFLAALESALGTDFGLSGIEGFDRAGTFRIYFSSPTSRTFNYADAGDGLGAAESMFWLAKRFSQPVYAWQEHQQLERTTRPHALDLVWFQSKTTSPAEANWPRNAMFRGVDVAFLRSSWVDPNAVFVGIKGGDNKANHSHLDLGSFVYDVGTTRFATDLGGDDYNLPQYFGKLRWTYYRLNTLSHNTVVFDNQSQDPKAEAPLVSFDAKAGRAIIDLSKANGAKTKKWHRTAELNGITFTIQDDIEAAQPVEPLWGFITEASVDVDGRKATLRKDGRTVIATLKSPADAKFEVVSSEMEKPQKQNAGTRRLVVRLAGPVTRTTIEVALAPE